MYSAQAEKLQSLIKYEISDEETHKFREWFFKQFEDNTENPSCTLEEFSIYFLYALREYTRVHLQTNVTETLTCITPVGKITPNCTKDDLPLQKKSTPINDKIDMKSTSHNEFWPKLNTSIDRSCHSENETTSTPVRRNMSNNSRRKSTTPGSSSKNAPSTLCLGDFLVTNISSHTRPNKKKSTSTATKQVVSQIQTDKPKKRVKPISISNKESLPNSSIFAGESSFSNENNILKISNTELEDKDQCAILAARKSLKLNASEITQEMETVSKTTIPVIADTMTTSTPLKKATAKEIPLDLKHLENNILLKKLSQIYSIIIDLNLTTNVLSELSFLLNLLNAPGANNLPAERCDNVNSFDIFECLQDLSHAIYFAVLCLTHEMKSLGSLDKKSLGVVLISERFPYLPDDVKSYLKEIYQCKQQLEAEKPFSNASSCIDSKSCNVYFQTEEDSKQNCTYIHGFECFRSQRNLFYRCLKIWDSNHLNPMWNFSKEIRPHIQNLLQISKNCVNMKHLARLFVSKLLLLTSNAASPEEIGLDVDVQKFSKLSERLITPSQFSVDYQFPRAEAFFRDFIMEARSLSFTEQLKMELYAELISQNDSPFSYIDISKTKCEFDEQNISLMDTSQSDNIVKPNVLNSMLILAKFLGFITSLPYTFDDRNIMSLQFEKDQIRLRNLMQPTFDVCRILEQGIEQNKLLIIIPWLVQYFAMLDKITLQLEPYMKALKLMFALYSYFGGKHAKPFTTTSIFIMKLCLGWLFESSEFISKQYYNFRAIYNTKSSQKSNVFDFIKIKLNHESENNALNPYLELLMPIACPFLAEFRVSIMPANYAQTKNASRTGRYRHITTRVAEIPCTTNVKEGDNDINTRHNKPKQLQDSLLKAFLRSQSASTRQIIVFCIERCYRSVVKDGQLKIVLPAKANADNMVNKITSSEYNIVYNEIKIIYESAHTQTAKKWQDTIPGMLHKRIRNALESLLPEETSAVLKRTYFVIIEKEANEKISQWFQANIIEDDFFCKNLEIMAQTICKANKKKVQLDSSKLIITKESPSISDLIDELQYWLHCTSVRVDLFKDSTPLVQLLRNVIMIFDNILPSLLYNVLGMGIIQLLQNVICRHCTHLTDELIEAACHVWLHPNMQKNIESSISCGTCIYDTLVNIVFLESLGTRKKCFNQFGRLIVIMIKKQIISVNYVNERFVSIFKHEWDPSILSEISDMLRDIAKEAAAVPSKSRCDNIGDDEHDDDEDEKSALFMDMLADFSRDVNFF